MDITGTPEQSPTAISLCPGRPGLRWSRWNGETQDEFQARVTAEAEALGASAVHFAASSTISPSVARRRAAREGKR